MRLWDARTGQLLASLVPLPGRRGLFVSPEGHYHCAELRDGDLVFVKQMPDGRQITVSAGEFSKQHGWVNNPARASLAP